MAKSDRMQFPPLGSVKLAGSIAEQMDAFLFERIFSEEAQNIVYREAEDAFRNCVDDEQESCGIWQGEYWGKWMIGAVRVCEYTGNSELRTFIRAGVHRMLGLQRPDGYLGTYRNSLNMFPGDPEKNLRILGWPCNWNWNIWCRKYTLWGLLECWRLLAEPEILDAARRFADHLIAELRDNGIDLGLTGTFAGIPSGSILKPVVLLYEATGETRYLDFAKTIAANWKRADNRCPNLIANALGGAPVHTWYPEPEKWAKAYEMLSCFDGLLELHRVTGDRELLDAAERFHRALDSERNPLLSVGFNDIFAGAAGQINAITEPCDVIHWMRLCFELFALTGESRYMDDFELAYCNAFLGSSYRDGKWGARGIRGQGRHLTALEQAKFTHNHCCVNNIPRGFMNAALAGASVGGDTICCNLYTPFTAALEGGFGSVSLEAGEGYLQYGETEIRFEFALTRPVTVRLRIPGWCPTARIESGGETFEAEGGRFFDLPPVTQSGSRTVKIRFQREASIRDLSPSGDGGPWFRKRWTEPGLEELYLEEPRSIVTFGPLLLARSRFNGNTEEEMFHSESIAGRGVSCRLTPEKPCGTRCRFRAEFTANGRSWTTALCDCASAGNVLSGDQRLFSIYL